MSEKLFALLFRLYPARFRARWTDDALDLIRERIRDERGFIPRLRLWYDLLADVAVSLPRCYMQEQPELAPVGSQQGAPLFVMLEDKPIRSSAYFFGTIFSIIALLGISLLSKHAGHFPIRHASDAAEARGFTADPWARGHRGEGGGSVAAIGDGRGPQGAAEGVKPATDFVRTVDPATVPFFDAAEKHRVLAGVAEILKQNYPDRASAQSLGKELLASEGRLARTNDPAAFAAAITQTLRAQSRDMHFNVEYSRESMAAKAAAAATTDALYRRSMLQANCMIADASVLPNKIGYLKLDWFPEPEVCGSAMISALNSLNGSDALIIDLRDNSGGSPAMVMFLAGWLFDRPAFLYNPREMDAAGMWTRSPMAGSRLANKPVYILTSSRSYSAAEHFSYDLKELRRATLVGETTGGASDAGVFHRVDSHFGIGLRESRVPNPYPEPDWAVTGVRPDVMVPASGALVEAERLASERLARR